MKILFPTLCLIFLFPIHIFAQNPVQTPKPNEKDDEVVKISTTLVQVDATVTDRTGKIVTNLRPEDFEIYENGKKQEITNFSFVSVVPENNQLPTAVKSDKNSVGVPIPPVQLRPEQVRRTIVIVVDNKYMPFDGFRYVKRGLREFVDKQMQPGDLVAIISTDRNVGALQQFTADKNQISKAIDNLQWNPRGGISAFEPIGTPPVKNAETPQQNSMGRSFEGLAKVKSLQQTDNASDLLQILEFVINGMRELSGRKSVMLFSNSLIMPNIEENERANLINTAIMRVVETANRSAVTIYTQDSKGMVYTGITARDEIGIKPGAMGEIMEARAKLVLDSQEGLIFLAKETGGQAIINSTEPEKGLEKLMEENRGYYLLAYQPDSDSFDAKNRKFNKLTVKVKQNGLNVRSRSGFFNTTEFGKEASAPKNQTPVEQMVKALSSPFAANQINLRLNALFGSDNKSSLFVHSILHIEAKDLQFTDTPDGFKKAEIEVLAMSFGKNGTMVDQVGKTHTLEVKGETYKNILQNGFIYSFILPVKKSGAYQMRVVLRDKANAAIGSASQFIEIPDLKKGDLNLSGIILENSAEKQRANPMQDTALRRFKRGTMLRYTTEIYNAKLDQANKPNLNTQIKVFRDGKMILDGKPNPLNPAEQKDSNKINFIGALNLGAAMPAGEYVLQIIVTDNLAKDNQPLATQWVQFEITE